MALAYDHESRIVKVPGSNGKQMCAAVEDVRAALRDSCFSNVVQDSIDVLGRGIEHEIVGLDSGHDEQSVPTFNEEDDDEHFESSVLPKVGDAIDVYSQDDNKFYTGIVLLPVG